MNNENSKVVDLQNEQTANRLTLKTIWIFYVVGAMGLLGLDISGVGATSSVVLYSALAGMLIPYAISTYVYLNYNETWVKYVLIITGFITVGVTVIMTNRAPFVSVLWVLPLFLCILYNNQAFVITFTVLANIGNLIAMIYLRPLDLTLNDVQGSIISLIAISAVTLAVSRRDIEKTRASTEQKEDIIEKSKATAANVHNSGQFIAKQIDDLSTSIDNIASTATQLSTSLQSFNERLDQISEYSQEVSTSAEKGQEGMESLLSNTSDINEVMDEIQSNMTELMQQSEEIGTIVLQIKDIAFQTNLLAINASVEAARAGETGRGFAVVAEEVNRLSEQTTQFADQIDEMVKKANQTSTKVQNSMEAGINTIKKDTGMIEDMGSTMESVLTKAKNIASNTQEIASNVKELSAGGENLAASVQEQRAATEEVSYKAQELLEESIHLEDELNSK